MSLRHIGTPHTSTPPVDFSMEPTLCHSRTNVRISRFIKYHISMQMMHVSTNQAIAHENSACHGIRDGQTTNPFNLYIKLRMPRALGMDKPPIPSFHNT